MLAAPLNPRKRPSGEWTTFTGTRTISFSCLVCMLIFAVGFYLGGLRAERDVQHASAESPAALPALREQRTGGGQEANPAHDSSVPELLLATTAAPAQRCDDSCSKAKNGVCDDGANVGQVQRSVYCDLGTDCSDCGQQSGMPEQRGSWREGGPVGHLLAKQVDLYTRRTTTRPSFQVMYTDPTVDLDVSEMLHRMGMLELGITAIFNMVLKGNCVDQATGRRKLVLDVGANFGYFTALAAKLGCRVIAWEPIPHFRAMLEYVVAANNISDLVSVRGRAVIDRDGERIDMQAPTKGILGTASLYGISQHKSQEPSSFTVSSERVDSVVDEDVLLMKVDVEGFETLVFKSAERLLSTRVVDHIILEYSPGVAEAAAVRGNSQFLHLLEDNPRMLLNLINKGFRIGMMHDHISKGGNFAPRTLPALPQVTAVRLRHDLEDVAVLQRTLPNVKARGWVADKELTCPIKPELYKLNSLWSTCTHTPEDLHPKSLRSTFHYNTNLWAARDGKLIKFDGLAGAMGPEQDASKEWFVNAQEPLPFAMASRSCKYLPVEKLVRHRCSCDWSIKQGHAVIDVEKCRAEERVINKLFAEGRFNFTEYERSA